MADVIRKATNKFTRGLIMDFSPENTKNEVLTHALNATLLTFNGNELSLQNDMGNARVETAYLPEGYMPVGTCEYGGIIYIVSYNPLEDKSLIGCFPSPERNISNDELGKPDALISKLYFLETDKDSGEITGNILHNTLYVLLKNDKLNPGDKFIVCAEKTIYNEKLADLWVDKDDKYYSDNSKNPKDFELISNPIISLNIVSIEDSGKIVYLNNDIKLYEEFNSYNLNGITYQDIYKYHILGKMLPGANQLAKEDLDNYRNVLSSGYSVFKSKTSGKLAILAELIMIDSYSVTHEIRPHKSNGEFIDGTFDIIIHTEITPEITESNYKIVPKLQYYYLDNSLGYIQVSHPTLGNTTKPLFKVDETTGKVTKEYNNDFYNTPMNMIYTAIDKDLQSIIDPLDDKPSPTLGSLGLFNFPKPYTYHGRMVSYDEDIFGTVNNLVYTKFTEGKYHRINYSLVSSNIDYFIKDVLAKFYYYNSEGKVHIKYEEETINETYTYYVKESVYIYNDAQRDIVHKNKKLYRLLSSPATATEDQIYDTSVEKFQYQEIHTYRIATEEDKENGEKLYYKEDDGQTYILLTGTPEDDVIYYVLKIEENLVSIGFEIDLETILGSIYYYPTKKDYQLATEEEIKKYYDFDTYKYEPEAPYGCPITLYWLEENWIYVEATELLINEYIKDKSELYYSTDYILLPQIKIDLGSGLLFMVVPMDTFIDSEHFEPNESYNYIEGKDKPDGDYPKDDPISLYTLADFIPENIDPDADDKENANKLKYNSIKLAEIKIPNVIYNNGLDLPFKYDYTIVPCMNYGRLNHLAVSNTVDFSKLYTFNLSNFHTWKYRIDESLLRLTFGTDVYDTYEESKVDGIILEFYDCWGFAGSLEILDKKSYSGIFTKVIPLNSLKVLSQYRVLGNKRVNSYKRNINIKEKYDESNKFIGYTFDNENFNATDHWNEETGWSKISEESNDCGTLYTNIVYGVKTYFRRTLKNGEKEYIKKQDFYLYTLPIYNDYYYSVQDFSNLEKPELDLALTYKLKDNSIKTNYNTEGIVDGYNKTDKENLENYLGGFYNTEKSSSLNLIKYIKYKGTSELYLEVGLNKKYENLNISYDPLINDRFLCSLQLVSDDNINKTLTVNSVNESIIGPSLILNYNNGLVTILENVNVLGFEDSTAPNTYQNKKLNFKISNSNFINKNGGNPIKINYEFVVGYTASINDIRNTQVLATTVCALFHKNPEGEYNYSDFGVYVLTTTNNEGNTVSEILSDIMFYNEGTSKKEIFGICRQTKSEGANMSEECQSITSVETDALEIKTAGKLNTGDPLRLLVGYIGKLTFCQPHAHGISEGFGVNIHEGSKYPNYYGIPPEIGNWGIDDGSEDTYATVPRSYLFNNPKYNLCVNTKNSINYHSEFISALDFKIISNREVLGCNMSDSPDEYSWRTVSKMREYTGLTGLQLSIFNKKLLETMKSVYAYNPDYDSLTVNKGNVVLQDYNPYFTSNLLSIDSKLDFEEGETLNNFIYLGPIKFSHYLTYLNKFSSYLGINNIKVEQEIIKLDKVIKKPIPQLELTASYNYCGTPENYYLISSLTYNTPVPQEIKLELEFNTSDLIVIKHSNGENSFMQGTPNKKILYGYNAEFNKMIQLDVCNYNIDSNGVLTMKNEGDREKSSLTIFITEEQNIELYNGSISLPYTFTDMKGETRELNINFGLNMGSFNTTFSKLKLENGYFILGTLDYYSVTGGSFTIYPYVNIYGTLGNYIYSAKIDNIEFECFNAQLNDSVSLYDYPIALVNLPYSEIHKLTDPNYWNGTISFTNLLGNIVEGYKWDYLVNTDAGGGISINGNYAGLGDYCVIPSDNNGNFNFIFNHMQGVYTGLYVVGLVELKIKSITITVTQTSKLENTPENFIHTTRTNKYSKFGSIDPNDNSTYNYLVLSDYNNTRLRGSSLTINDLVYEPNKEGHRLFIRNNLYVYKPYLRGKLYYRALDYDNDDNWYYDETQYLNNLFFFTGPCYTSDNLN